MFYALLFSWLVLWANCFFPAIQSVRVGAFMKSDINAVLRSGEFVNDKDVFNRMMHEMTGGDQMVLKAIKQIARNTMDGISFSLDPIIEHAKNMAPRMVEHSSQLIARFSQRVDYADASRKLVQFVTQATGNSYEADQVLDILDSNQDDPRETTNRLIKFMSRTNDFVSDCIAQTRSLMSTDPNSEDYDFEEARQEYLAIQNRKSYLFWHPFEHPSATYRHFLIATIVILGLWLGAMIYRWYLGANITDTVRVRLKIFRILVFVYCMVFLVVAVILQAGWFVPFLVLILLPATVVNLAIEFKFCRCALSALFLGGRQDNT
ncbi:hypothetical protein MIR68_008691 [Amoeboaphelidium protococcarum]|nr:hypothetical protein MIR68_008691 [Amoeboaphelidium protococcarum]